MKFENPYLLEYFVFMFVVFVLFGLTACKSAPTNGPKSTPHIHEHICSADITTEARKCRIKNFKGVLYAKHS